MHTECYIGWLHENRSYSSQLMEVKQADDLVFHHIVCRCDEKSPICVKVKGFLFDGSINVASNSEFKGVFHYRKSIRPSKEKFIYSTVDKSFELVEPKGEAVCNSDTFHRCWRIKDILVDGSVVGHLYKSYEIKKIVPYFILAEGFFENGLIEFISTYALIKFHGSESGSAGYC